MAAGIYAIASPSGGRYVGSAVDLSARWRVHRHLLSKGRHHNVALQRAWNKRGESGLSFLVLLICRKEDLLFYEQLLIDGLTPRYNRCRIAGSQLGQKHSKESNEKNAAAHRGRKLSLAH